MIPLAKGFFRCNKKGVPILDDLPDVRNFTEVMAIDRSKKTVMVKDLRNGEAYEESYDKIILSPGAEPLRPPIDGIELDNIFNLRNIPDSDRIKRHIDTRKPKTGVIVGGGFIGLEMAENLVLRGVETTIIEMMDQVMAPLDFEMAGLVQAHLKEKGVRCVLGTGVTSFSERDGRLNVTTSDGNDYTSDLVILSIGIRPENRLAREAGLEIGERGGIKVDAGMRTSDPDIFAVGDAVEVKDFITGRAIMTALAGPANKQGRIAADNAMGRKSLFKGTLGTAVVKVFEMTIASTGANEKILTDQNIPYEVSYTHSGSHASYYPGSETMAIKLIFSPSNGKILGAQIVGKGGVDKRIDVIATAIRGAMTVYDLEELELAYAPPYSSAKDPINVAGFVAANILKGDMDHIQWGDLAGLDKETNILIDLRNKKELEKSGEIEGAWHVPLDELRGHLSKLDREKHYIPFCAAGLRAYLGHRILIQNGLRSKNLSGGYITYRGGVEKS